MTTEHTPIPDGASGPWLRKRHARSFTPDPRSVIKSGYAGAVIDQGYAFDPRCEYCRQLMWAGQAWSHQDTRSKKTHFWAGVRVKLFS